MMLPVLLAAATASVVATESTLVDRLVAEGFENVAVEQRGQTTYVWFEDRRSLDPTTGLGQVARLALPTLATEKVELVPLRERLPVIGVGMRLNDLGAFLKNASSEEAFAAYLTFDVEPPDLPPTSTNSSVLRPELAITPGYSFSDRLNGYLNFNIRSQVAQGWHAVARAQTQIYPDWSIYPAFLLLGGHRQLAPRVDAAWSIGRWNSERYGAEGELAGWLGHGEWLWRLRTSVVTTLVPAAVATIEYRLPWADTFTRAGGGFYPAGDRALFLTFGRIFSRSEVEAGYFRSDFGNQLRASISTYLGPDRRPDPSPFRVEAPGWFEVDYRATAPRGATLLWPEPEAGISWRRLTPDYVRKHLSTWR